MKKFLIGIIAATLASLGGYAGYQSIGADAVLPIAGQTYTLAGAGMSSTDTSFTLTSFTITQNGYKIQDTDLSETFYITIEPGSRSRQEIVSCTTATQNGNGTASISGCTRGLSPVTPYTASTTLRFAHSGGASVIFSDPPQLFNQVSFKDNDETITGSWSFPTPLSGPNAATKTYVDSLVTGGSLTYDSLVFAGTAGETIGTGTIVYMKPTDQRWWKVDVDDTTTFSDRFLGISQGTATAGNAVPGGILTQGYDTTQTGMTVGATYYASSTAGGTSTAVTAQPLGITVSATAILFNPPLLGAASETGANTFTGTNTFSATTSFAQPPAGVPRVRYFSTSTTYSKPAGLNWAFIRVWSGGGSGGSGSSVNSEAGGGGGGGCVESWVASTTLATTETITIGAGGTAVSGDSNGNRGATTTFGSLLAAPPGGAGGGGGTVGAGGGGGGGAMGTGGNAITATAGAAGDTFASVGGTLATGSPALRGAGGGGADNTIQRGQPGGASYECGGGGGGGAGSFAGGAGGTSAGGGAGGAGSNSTSAVNASTGSQPAGGGGGRYTGGGGSGSSGAGGDGMVIIFEYF